MGECEVWSRDFRSFFTVGSPPKKKILLRDSDSGFKGQGWRRCPAHTGAESPPQPPKAPPRGWGPRRDILGRPDAHH